MLENFPEYTENLSPEHSDVVVDILRKVNFHNSILNSIKDVIGDTSEEEDREYLREAILSEMEDIYSIEVKVRETAFLSYKFKKLITIFSFLAQLELRDAYELTQTT